MAGPRSNTQRTRHAATWPWPYCSPDGCGSTGRHRSRRGCRTPRRERRPPGTRASDLVSSVRDPELQSSRFAQTRPPPRCAVSRSADARATARTAAPARRRARSLDPQLVQRRAVRRLAIDAERPPPGARLRRIRRVSRPTPSMPRPPGGQQVPDGVADHVPLVGGDAHPLLARQEESGSGLARARRPVDHDGLGRDPERRERASISGRRPGGGDAVTTPARAGRRAVRRRPAAAAARAAAPGTARRAAAGSPRLPRSRARPDLARHGPREQPAAHPDPPMDPPAVDRMPASARPAARRRRARRRCR